MSKISKLVELLIADTEVITFEYSSEFVVGFQRQLTAKLVDLKNVLGITRLPPMFNLRLRNTWWVGEHSEWAALVEGFPIKGNLPIPAEAPLQASLLTCSLGSFVKSIIVHETGDLSVEMSNGMRIFISGTGGEWEESWFLELPVDDPDRDKWAIVCDSSGLISGHYPPE